MREDLEFYGALAFLVISLIAITLLGMCSVFLLHSCALARLHRLRNPH